MTLLDTINKALAEVRYPERPEGLYEPVEYVLGMGGKRLRPTLLLMAYSLYRNDIEKAISAAVGIETYHNHTLLHDDLMDKADMRRGKATVHKRWNENTAVLSGDTMFILAMREIMSCNCKRQGEVLDLFARSAQEICEGQQYDVNFETRTDVTEEEYIEMIRLKTSVLLGCAVKMGALIADAPITDANILYRFAERVGLAFQLQDDWLDVYGDPATFGKKIGGDILCGKKTYLLINAYNQSSPESKERLLRLIQDKQLPAQQKIEEVTNIYNQLGISDLTLQAIDRFYDEAYEELKRISLPVEKWQPLWEYAKSLLGRAK